MAVNIEEVFILLVLFQIKHFFSDFPLQREYMLKKTIPDWGFIVPLATHCTVHGVLTFVILMSFQPNLWWLAFFDFFAHFAMDRIKSGPKYLGRFNDKEKPGFWNALGFDQMIHHFTHYTIVWMIVTH